MVEQRPASRPMVYLPDRGTRRRGAQLENAIFAAVVAELAEAGYDRLTMEGVAARAQTGKAALYRRWPSKESLVEETLNSMLPPVDSPPDTGTVRGDLLELLGRMGTTMSSPTGCAIQSVMGSLHSSPDIARAIKSRVLEPRKQLLVDALRRGVDRGEVRADAATKLVADVGPSLIVHKFLHDGPPVTRQAIEEILDQVIMPMLRP